MTDVNKSLIEISSKFNKLDKFEVMDFRRWQKKMKFLLVTLRVGYVLNTPMSEKLFGDGDVEIDMGTGRTRRVDEGKERT